MAINQASRKVEEMAVTVGEILSSEDCPNANRYTIIAKHRRFVKRIFNYVLPFGLQSELPRYCKL